MVQEYIEGYVRRFISEMGFEVETVSYLQDGRIYCNINTSNNSILIGKAGVILRAINFIVKNAVSTTYKKRIELSIDINGYKEERYKKVASMARKLGKQVLRTKADIKLDPMPADERKVMHQELAKLDHVKTQSYGCLLYTSLTSNHSDNAFTTEAPTPCKPPDTLYPPPPNFPPACNTVKIVSTVEIPVFA